MSPSDDIRLFVIVPVYGNWEDTLDCLRNLSRQSETGFRVLISDDGSPSAPPDGILDFSFADYIRQPHRGFAGNANAAAAEAIRQGATHLLFLNSDTSFPAAFMEGWMRAVRRRPDAILSPVIYWFSDPSRIWFSGGNLSIWAPFFRIHRNFPGRERVDIVSGCAMLVPASSWRKLRGFAERYVMYFEDFDFTLRAKLLGIETFVLPDPDLHVRHKVAGSFRGSADWDRKYHMLTSSLLFIRTHYRAPWKHVCLGLSCAHVFAIVMLSLPHLPSPRLLGRALARGFFLELEVPAGLERP